MARRAWRCPSWCSGHGDAEEYCSGPVTDIPLDGVRVGLWLGTELGLDDRPEPAVVLDGLPSSPALTLPEAIRLAQVLLEQVGKVLDADVSISRG